MNTPALVATAAAITAFLLTSAGASAQGSGAVQHDSGELIELAREFRAFRSPLFRPRTWRPTHEVEEIPDYAEVKRRQTEGLEDFRRRLGAIDTAGLSPHEQVDYLLLRSEMDDVYFEQHVLREIETNPAWYVEQAVNRVAGELRTTVPYSDDKARAIIAALEATGPILAQARENLDIAGSAPALADMAIRYVSDIRSKFAAGEELIAPHVPQRLRRPFSAAMENAADALADYGDWVRERRDRMRGDPNVGPEAMRWYFKRVNFVPWSLEELLAIGEHEKNRFLMSIEIEETKNRGLPELTMPTTAEWIERFRLTYLQTKYWLKDMDLISFPDYVGESYLEQGAWQEPFGGIGNRPGLLGFPTEERPENSKRLFVVPEDHWFTETYWERTMRLEPITNYQHSDWPGHYFEAEVTRRNPCPIRAVHRDTGFSQGWAHYWEEFFMDMGYPFLRGPRTRELTYNFLLLRAVRVPMDIMLSTGELSVDEAVQYQIERVPTMEEHISRAEVDMYVRWPYQATSYIVGKKQIEQMLGETIMENDFSVDWRDFHDALLDYGQIPPALVRYELLGLDDQMAQFWEYPDTP